MSKAMARHPAIRRGEVWLVALDPTTGHEIKKTRPAIVVTNDVYNRYNWVVLVVPLSSYETADYDQVLIHPPEGGLKNPSVTLPDQLRAVDRQRLIRRMGAVSEQTMSLIDQSLRIVLDLI
jgi:mRNA interferase MazF